MLSQVYMDKQVHHRIDLDGYASSRSIWILLVCQWTENVIAILI